MKPHEGVPVLTAGERPESAAAAMIMIHGRGADARSILKLAATFNEPAFAYAAPDAVGHTWYPNSFLEEISSNEPDLSSALAVVGEVLEELSTAGIGPERTILLGFSQGACLALEYAARNPRRYGGVVALSGGLIGPELEPERYQGSLDATPVFLGCSDVDPYIPKERVQESAAFLKGMGGQVTSRLYPGLGHTVDEDEILHVRSMMHTLVS